MKKIIVSFFYVLSIGTASFAQQQTKSDYSDKSPNHIVKEVKEEKSYLVDVRTPEEYKQGHLLYASNIDFKSPEFKEQILKRLDKNKPVYLYCRSGNRSGKAADTLKALGFTHIYNIGGFEDLVLKGLPKE